MVNDLRIGVGLIELIKLCQEMHTCLRNWMGLNSGSCQRSASQEIFPEHVGR
jgi:hypothetical protein